MYCIECGSQNLDRAKFCQQCGAEMPASLRGLPAAEPEAAPPAAQPAVPVGLPVESPAAVARPAEPAPEEEKAAEPPAEEKAGGTAPPDEKRAAAEPEKDEKEVEAPPAEEKAGYTAPPEEERKPEPSAPTVEVPQAIPVMKITVPPEAKPAPPPGETTQPTPAQAKVETEAAQPTLPQAAARPPARPPTWPPKPPKSMKVLGIICIIAGSLNALINIIAAIVLVVKLSSIRGAGVPMIVHPIVSMLWIALAFILFLGGIGMVRGRLWGRKLCLFFAFSILPLVIVSAVAVKTADVIASVGGLSQSYHLLVSAGLFYPALMVVLVMALLTGRVKRWAEFMRAGPGVVPPAQPEPSMPAVFSLILALALIFPPVFCQLYSIILGFVGLRQISRSEGRKCGRGMAIAGLVISGLTLLLLVVGIVAAIIFANTR